MATTIDFDLPENLTISNIGSLHEELEALVEKQDCEAVVFKASAVQRADTAGIQLLAAFVFATRERQIRVTWHEPSDKLCNAVDLLGLAKSIGIH